MKRRARFPLLRTNIDALAPDLPGVYGFWCRTNGKCIYVGKAVEQTLKDRLIQEWGNSHNEGLKQWIQAFGDDLDVCYLPVQNHGKIGRMESTLIKVWHPEVNIMMNRRK